MHIHTFTVRSCIIINSPPDHTTLQIHCHIMHIHKFTVKSCIFMNLLPQCHIMHIHKFTATSCIFIDQLHNPTFLVHRSLAMHLRLSILHKSNKSSQKLLRSPAPIATHSVLPLSLRPTSFAASPTFAALLSSSFHLPALQPLPHGRRMPTEIINNNS